MWRLAITNTRYMNLALDSLCDEGFEIADEDIERFSQMRYHFTLAENVSEGEMRPLRDLRESEE